MVSLEIRNQHDEYGNAEVLRTDETVRVLEENAWYRASGDCICDICSKPYWKHHRVIGALWLTKLCNNDFVKF